MLVMSKLSADPLKVMGPLSVIWFVPIFTMFENASGPCQVALPPAVVLSENDAENAELLAIAPVTVRVSELNAEISTGAVRVLLKANDATVVAPVSIPI